MQENFVPIGIGPPMSLPVTITSVVADLTTATALSFNVTLPDNTTTTWSGFITSATKNQLVGGHAWATPDIQQVGWYFVEPTLTAPGGNIPCRPFSLDGGNATGI